MKRRLLTTGIFVLFLAVAVALVRHAMDPGQELAVGNIDHPGLHGELFHQLDFRDHVARGDLLEYHHSRLVGAPEGQSVRENIGFSLHLFFYLPLLWIKDLVLTTNILMVLALALNGFCGFLLGRHLGRSAWSGLVCGVMLFLSPFALLKLEQGFLQKVILWWIPLFVLYLVRFLEDRKKRDAFLSGAFWALMLLTYAPFAWYALWLGFILLAVSVLQDRTCCRELFVRGWIWGVPAVAAVALLLVVLPDGGRRAATGQDMPLVEAINGSVDVFHLFRFHPYHHFVPDIESLPLGISLPGLVLAGAALALRRRAALPFAIVAAFFFVISLGPYLHNNGQVITRLPLPGCFLAKHVPWGERLGFPIRALPLFEVAIAALAALALRSRSDVACRRKVALVCAGLVVLLVVERRATLPELFPPLESDASLTEEQALLKANPGQVLHLPVNLRGGRPKWYCYITARTGAPMMNRYLEQDPDFPLPPLEHPAPREMAAYLDWLRGTGCDYLVVHEPLFDEPEIEMLMPQHGPRLVERYDAEDTSCLATWCGEPLTQVFADMSIYVVPKREDLQKTLSDPFAWAAVGDSLPGPAFSGPELAAEFERAKTALTPYNQIRLQHVLADSQEEAEALRDRMQQSAEASFAATESRSLADDLDRRWGDIGYVSGGTFPVNIDTALSTLQAVGDMAVVKDDNGYHVFRLMDVREARIPTLEDSIGAVEDRLARKRLAAQPVSDAGTSDMILIEGGTFFMGSTEKEIDRAAAMAGDFVGRSGRKVDRRWFEDEIYREVTVPSFTLDKHEVTVRQYARFLAESGHAHPLGWARQSAGTQDLPVTGVTWHDARAYARWTGKRLPTAAEWEYAARGSARRWFPWGDEKPDGTRANYADRSTDFGWRDREHDDGYAGLAPVGSYPAGATPAGLLDMAGNVREWTDTFRWGVIDPADGHIWSYAQRDAVKDSWGSGRIAMAAVKGGAWENAADDMRCSDERILPLDVMLNSLGFRCARSIAAHGPRTTDHNERTSDADSQRIKNGPLRTKNEERRTKNASWALPDDFPLPEIVFGGATGCKSREEAQAAPHIPIVMVPDIGRDHSDWTGAVAAAFRTAGFEPGDLWMIDFAPRGKQMTSLEEATDDLKMFMAAVMKYTGASRVQLLGHGAGAVLSRLTILKYNLPHWVASEVYIDAPFHGLDPAPDPVLSLQGQPNAAALCPGSDLLREIVARGENPLFHHPLTQQPFRIPTLTLRGDSQSPALLWSWNIALPGLGHDALRVSGRATEVYIPFLDRDRDRADLALYDRDEDGFTAFEAGGADFNDEDPSVFPGAEEIRGDGIDQDCNGCDVALAAGRDIEMPVAPAAGDGRRHAPWTPWLALAIVGVISAGLMVTIRRCLASDGESAESPAA